MQEGKSCDFWIIDTHNTLDALTVNALKIADVVLVPVYADYNSLINLRSVWQYLYDLQGGKGNVALVKNSISKLKLAAEFEKAIDAQGYQSAARLPRSNILVRNIASGICWDKSMSLRQHKPFRQLYDNIWSAYRDMLSENFHHLWRD